MTYHIIYANAPLYNGVDRAGLLAETTVDALGHVNIVARRAAGAVGALLRFDGDRLGRADGLAQLASDTSVLHTITAVYSLSTRATICPRSRTQFPSVAHL